MTTNDRLDTMLGKLRELERDIVQETHRKAADFCYQIKDREVRFAADAKAKHKKMRVGFHRYLVNSRFLVILTTPVIWLCVVPIVLSDVIGTFYQAICFPIYGIPKVKRHEYVSFDRRHLAYLNFAEKFNCVYCGYVNGILAYFTEIAARTEQHWCPIKHAHCEKCAHSRYKTFIDFGDAEGYRKRVEEVRRSYGDLEAAAAATAKVNPVDSSNP